MSAMLNSVALRSEFPLMPRVALLISGPSSFWLTLSAACLDDLATCKMQFPWQSAIHRPSKRLSRISC